MSNYYDSDYNNSILCHKYYNSKCIICSVVEENMNKVGAFILCDVCFERIFNVTEFKCDSKLGEIYYKLLDEWKKE